MRRRQRRGDREQRLNRVGRREALLPAEDRGQRLSVEELHDDERITLLGLAEIEDPDDRRVLEASGGARLLEETAGRLGRGAVAAKQLHRDVHVEREVVREPHRAHASGAR